MTEQKQLGIETLDNFFKRVFVDFTKEKVLVYAFKIGEGEMEVWTLKKAREYIRYLKTEEMIT